MEAIKIHESSLPLRIIPESRVLFDDVRRYRGDRMTKRDVIELLGDTHLVEQYPYRHTWTEAMHMIPPKEFPARAVLMDKEGKATCRLVKYGTRVSDVMSEWPGDVVPEGHTVLWFSMILRGTSLQTLSTNRYNCLSPHSTLPNCLNNAVSFGVVVEESDSYLVFRNIHAYNGSEYRLCPGPPLYIVPMPSEDDHDRIMETMASAINVYTARRMDASQIRLLGERMSPSTQRFRFLDFTVRYSIRGDDATNEIEFVGGSLSDLVPYVETRALYIGTWQRIERSNTDVRFTSADQSCMDNTTYQMDVDGDGRVRVSYFLPLNRNGGVSSQSVSPITQIEFDDAMTTPSTLYNTEEHCMKRLGVFDSSVSMFATLDNTIPAHASRHRLPQERRDAVWHDEVLYTYQKEGVEAMLAHEAMADGLMGMYMSRLTGSPGQPGMFRDLQRRSWYIEGGFDTQVGMLCDDTGMGKTRQIVSVMKYAPPQSTATLVVVPPSIINQWISEIRSVWPECNLVVMYGRTRAGVDLGVESRSANVVITTYSTMTKWESQFSPITWSRIVFDESHTIPISVVHMHLRGTKTWFLTATPDVGWRRTCDIIVGSVGTVYYLTSLNTMMTSHARPAVNEAQWRMVRPLVFRRTRARYLELPPVNARDVMVDLTDSERARYADVVSAMREYRTNVFSVLEAVNVLRQLQHVASTNTQLHEIARRAMPVVRDSWFHPEARVPASEVPEDTDCSICICPFENPVRTICQHWFCRECIGNALIRKNTCPLCRGVIDPGSILAAEDPAGPPEPMDTTGTEGTEGTEGTTGAAADGTTEGTAAEGTTSTTSSDGIAWCTKMERVVADVKEALASDPSDRVLVFFETQTMLDVYKARLEREGIRSASIHGGVSVSTRSRRIDQFQYNDASPLRVMLLTIKTASAGITLTRANHVMLVTPVANRDLETQMVGRSHRLGQRKPVSFTRYIAAGTIEEQIASTALDGRHLLPFVQMNVFER